MISWAFSNTSVWDMLLTSLNGVVGFRLNPFFWIGGCGIIKAHKGEVDMIASILTIIVVFVFAIVGIRNIIACLVIGMVAGVVVGIVDMCLDKKKASKPKSNDEMDDLEFDEMNDIWDEMDEE